MKAAGWGNPAGCLRWVTEAQLEGRIERGDLPDAIFTVSDLPSPLVRRLVARRRYKLVALPFGEAFALESFDDEDRGTTAPATADEIAKFRIYPTVIPAYTYGVEPPSPSSPLPTFGPRLLLVANPAVSSEAVRLVLLKNEALSRFAEGKLEGEALMSGFVTHVNDARDYLTRLILHERDNLENRANSERRSAGELWLEVTGTTPGDAGPAQGETT